MDSITIRSVKAQRSLMEWSQRVADCRSSGQPVARWCAEHDINPKTYYNHAVPVLWTAAGSDQGAVLIPTSELVQFLDPLCRGDYRRGKPDFIGFNLYHGAPARMGVNGSMPVPFPDGTPRTAMGWPVTPEAMAWAPRFLHERYPLPLVISENGFALEQERDMPHDADRIEWTAAYLRALAEVADECDVRGYFHWSLLDNFEWAEGYRPRFGLVHVDFATGKRAPKDSATWYAAIMRNNKN